MIIIVGAIGNHDGDENGAPRQEPRRRARRQSCGQGCTVREQQTNRRSRACGAAAVVNVTAFSIIFGRRNT